MKTMFLDTIPTNQKYVTHVTDTLYINKNLAIDTVSTNENYDIDILSMDENYELCNRYVSTNKNQ